jgi:Flp pilus assembly pilin Flp
MQRIIDAFRSRFQALRNDERGMEAAQVILILVVVVGLIVAVIVPIQNALKTRGAAVNNSITGINQ